jgi:hypothetical protein
MAITSQKGKTTSIFSGSCIDTAGPNRRAHPHTLQSLSPDPVLIQSDMLSRLTYSRKINTYSRKINFIVHRLQGSAVATDQNYFQIWRANSEKRCCVA